MKAPHARYRLYTSWRSYLPFLRDLLLRPEPSESADLFLHRLGEFLGAERVTDVPMCRSGIYLAVKHSIRPGQDVVMSPYTIVDVVNMVIAAGGRPVFADIERSTCAISPRSIETLIHSGTGAVLVTHLHGIPAPVREICELCGASGIPVIEDAAQAFGALLGGARLGTVADLGVYSFGTYKNLNSWYGGAITCKEPERFLAIKREADQMGLQGRAGLVRRALTGLVTDIATQPHVFRSLSYWIFRWGALHDVAWINRFVESELDLSRRDHVPHSYLGRMTPAQHRLCLAQLDCIDRDSRARVEKAARYREGLRDIGGVLLPRDDEGTAIYTYFPIQYGDDPAERRRLLRYMARRGCDVGPQHLKNCADIPAFGDLQRDCPNARRAAGSVVLLPTYPDYPDRDVAHNLEVLADYASRSPS